MAISQHLSLKSEAPGGVRYALGVSAAQGLSLSEYSIPYDEKNLLERAS